MVTEKSIATDAPPPGAGFVTTTGKAPMVARSDEVSEIVSWVALRKSVECTMPSNVTVDEARKPVPLIVSVRGVESTINEAGASEVIVGTGLFAAVTVNGSEFDGVLDAPGFVTEICLVPTAMTRLDGTLAISVDELCHAAARDVPPKFTDAPGRKFDPMTLKLKPGAPAVTCLGVID